MNEINKIIEKELKQISLRIGLKNLTEEQKEEILNLLERNNIKYEFTILTMENPLKIIKANLNKTKKNRNLINKIKEVLKE